MSQSPESTSLTVADKMSATLLTAYTAEQAAAFTSPDDFIDDNGPVLYELLNNRVSPVFYAIRDGYAYVMKLQELLAARPRDKFNRWKTPVIVDGHTCYTWGEICHVHLHRDPRTIRRLLEEPKTAEQVAAEKDARKHAKHVKSNAAALAAHEAAPNTEIIRDGAGNVLPPAIAAKVLADEAKLKAAQAASVEAEPYPTHTITQRADGLWYDENGKEWVRAKPAAETLGASVQGDVRDWVSQMIPKYRTGAAVSEPKRKKPTPKQKQIIETLAAKTLVELTRDGTVSWFEGAVSTTARRVAKAAGYGVSIQGRVRARLLDRAKTPMFLAYDELATEESLNFEADDPEKIHDLIYCLPGCEVKPGETT